MSRVGILLNKALQRADAIAVLLVGNVGATKLILRIINILTTTSRHYTVEGGNLLCSLILHAERDSSLILGIVTLPYSHCHRSVVALHSRRELTGRVVDIASAVHCIGTERITLAILLEEGIKRLGCLLHILVVEVAVAQIVVSHSILLRTLWSTTDEVAVSL